LGYKPGLIRFLFAAGGVLLLFAALEVIEDRTGPAIGYLLALVYFLPLSVEALGL
jgi:hypothetical protein